MFPPFMETLIIYKHAYFLHHILLIPFNLTTVVCQATPYAQKSVSYPTNRIHYSTICTFLIRSYCYLTVNDLNTGKDNYFTILFLISSCSTNLLRMLLCWTNFTLAYATIQHIKINIKHEQSFAITMIPSYFISLY